MRIIVGSDERTHLTDMLIEHLLACKHIVDRVGPLAGEDGSWPDVAASVAEAVAGGQADEGILCCWTGTGVSIAANKVPGNRAALCYDAETAKGARLWNRANVLCLSLRATSEPIAREILDAWLNTPLGTEPSDVACVAKLHEIEDKFARVQPHS
jgi:ribose 5-phosphate isomerase B